MSETTIWTPWATAAEAEHVLGSRPGVAYVPFLDPAELPDDPAQATMVVLPYAQNPAPIFDRIDEFSQLRLIQAQMAGTDNINDRVPEGVTLCNAAGVHDAATAELALALTLASNRTLDQYARDQTQGQWQPHWAPGLAYQRVLIFGYGRIGKAIERRLRGFEPASITRVATSARTEDLDGEPVQIQAADQLPDLLGETDIAIIIAPLTDATRGLFDANLLARLPHGALLVNMGRGPIVDTDALIEACQSGRLRAALDVINPEPVPADHRLRTTPGVFFSPHVGGLTDAFAPRRDHLLRQQVERFLAGDELDNVVIAAHR